MFLPDFLGKSKIFSEILERYSEITILFLLRRKTDNF